MLFAISHHVQVLSLLRVRDAGTLYLCPMKMLQLFTKLIHTVHVNKASAWRKKRGQTSEILKAFLSLAFLFFCLPPPPPYSIRSPKQR